MLYVQVYLLGSALLLSPKAWLAHLHTEDIAWFWEHLETSQYVFLAVYPICEVAQCLVGWYSLAVAWEKYMVLFHTSTIWR